MASLSQPLSQGRYKQVRLLVNLGVNINQCDSSTKRTPVMLCCQQPPSPAVLSLMKMLLSKGADTTVTDRDGRNALGVAILADNTAAVRVLLTESHLDLNLNQVDRWGMAPLHLAVQVGSVAMVKMLVTSLRRNFLSVDTRDSNGMTALMMACKLGRPDMALILVRFGKASLSMRDNIRFWSAEEWLKGSELAIMRPDILEITTKAFRLPAAKKVTMLTHKQSGPSREVVTVSPESEPLLAPKSEPMLTPRSDAVLTPKPKPVLVHMFDAVLAPKPKSVLVPKSQAVLAARPKSGLGPRSEPEPLPRSELVVAPRSEAVLTTRPKPELSPKSDAVLAPRPKSGLGPRSQLVIAPTSEAVIAPKAKREFAAKPEPEPIPESGLVPSSGPDQTLAPQLDDVMNTDYRKLNYIHPKIGSLASTTGNIHVRRPLTPQSTLIRKHVIDVMHNPKVEMKIPLKITINNTRLPSYMDNGIPLSRSKSAKVVRFQRAEKTPTPVPMRCYLSAPTGQRTDPIPPSIEYIKRPSSTGPQPGFDVLYSLYSVQNSASYRKSAVPPPEPPKPPVPEVPEKPKEDPKASARSSSSKTGSRSGKRLTTKKLDNIMQLMMGRKKKTPLLSTKSEGATSTRWGKLKLGALTAGSKSEPLMQDGNKEDKAVSKGSGRRNSSVDKGAAQAGSEGSSASSMSGPQKAGVSALLKKLRAAKPDGSVDTAAGDSGSSVEAASSVSVGQQVTSQGSVDTEVTVVDESITRCVSVEPLSTNHRSAES